MKKKPFGHLFALDLYNCQSGVCDDLNLCYKFLEDVTAKLKMNSQSPPFVFKSDAVAYPDKAGISGWIPLIESGIQIHTLTCRDFISIDIYSCREFSTSDLSEFVQQYFGSSEVETNYVPRGIDYHKAQKL